MLRFIETTRSITMRRALPGMVTGAWRELTTSSSSSDPNCTQTVLAAVMVQESAAKTKPVAPWAKATAVDNRPVQDQPWQSEDRGGD